MNNNENGNYEQLQAFLRLWQEIFGQQAVGAESQTRLWGLGLEKLRAEAGESEDPAVSALLDNLSAAGGFYAHFVESMAASEKKGDEATLLMGIPRQLFEQHLGAVGVDQKHWDSWVELMRQRPETATDFATTLQNLQQALARYLVGFSEVVQQSAEAFKGKQEQETSQDAFKRWLSAFESRYQSYIRDPDFPVCFGDVVNGMAGLNQQMKLLLKPWCEMNDLPDPSQWSGMHQKLKELESENTRLKQELECLRQNAAQSGA